MKKYIYLLLIGLIMCGCQSEINLKRNYDIIISEIKEYKSFDTEYPFDVEVQVYQKNNKYEYSVIIDNFLYELDNVKAIVYDGKQDIYVSIGIFDNPVKAIPKKNEKRKSDETKGIILNQESEEKEINIIVYITYDLNGKNHKKVIEVKK